MTLDTQWKPCIVTAAQAAAVGHLTWNLCRPLLDMAGDERQQNLRPLCLAVWHDGMPAGLVVSRRSSLGDGGQSLLSLMVERNYRRRGIASALLKRLRDHLPEDARALDAHYSDKLPAATAFGAVLAADGWNAPQVRRRRICGRVGDTHAIFRNRDSLLRRLSREGFIVQSWEQAGEGALALAAQAIAAGQCPEWADPRPWCDHLHPTASLVLTDPAGTVHGWAVCEWQAPMRRWYFPVGWVSEPQASHGWLLGAYAEGARRLAATHGEDAMAVFESGHGAPAMWRVLERRFSPNVLWSDLLLEVRRD